MKHLKYFKFNSVNFLLIITFNLLFASFSLYAGNPIYLNISPSQKNIVISLKTNPSTGFSWSIKSYDQTILKLNKTTYEAPHNKPQVLGASGKIHYIFDIIATPHAKNTKIIFIYQRPWEPKTGVIQKVIINFSS